MIKNIFVIYYFTASIAEAHQLISETYSAPSVKTCEYWFQQFKSGNFVYTMGKIWKDNKWVPYELSELAIQNRLIIRILLLLVQKEIFVSNCN